MISPMTLPLKQIIYRNDPLGAPVDTLLKITDQKKMALKHRWHVLIQPDTKTDSPNATELFKYFSILPKSQNIRIRLGIKYTRKY